jgi:LytS/YehU family sensor histidine kinase
VNVESNSPLLGRYKVNDGPWESWDLGGPILLEYPAPGAYTVQIQIDTRADFASSAPTTYNYTIKALWYKRPASWAIIIFLLAAIIVFWQRRERIRVNERLELQERLAEAELESKRGQMNPHFLFNALDAISNFIFKNQPKDAVLYMGKLAKLMRLTLESSRNPQMVLADEVELLNKYIDLCILRYGSFNWQLELADNLDLYDTKLPPMLVQPLVENAVQHAVRPNFAEGKSGAIHAQISAKENALHIVIEDNGPGIEDVEKAAKSHGLAIIRERLDLLSKKNKAEYSFKLESIEKNGSILGTRVSLILPLESED